MKRLPDMRVRVYEVSSEFRVEISEGYDGVVEFYLNNISYGFKFFMYGFTINDFYNLYKDENMLIEDLLSHVDEYIDTYYESIERFESEAN